MWSTLVLFLGPAYGLTSAQKFTIVSVAALAGALIGIAGAVGAFGGVLVNVAFRESFLGNGNGDAAYLSFLIFYGLCFAVTWAVYLHPHARRLAGV